MSTNTSAALAASPVFKFSCKVPISLLVNSAASLVSVLCGTGISILASGNTRVRMTSGCDFGDFDYNGTTPRVSYKVHLP